MLRSIKTLLFLSLIYFPFESYAENSGRLKDGRAYRTGSNGFRIMDEVAELEVATGDMKRRILSLEDEVEKKDAIIKRLRGNKNFNSESLVEKDLLGRTSSGLPKAMTAESVKKKEQLCGSVVGDLNREVVTLKRQVQDSNRKQSSFMAKNAGASSQIASLQSELQDLRSKQAARDSEIQNFKLQKNASESEIASLNRRLLSNAEGARRQESLEISNLKQQVASLNSQLSGQIDRRDSQTASLQSRLQSAESSNIGLQSQIDSLQSRLAQKTSEYEQQIASLQSRQNQRSSFANSSRAKLSHPVRVAPSSTRVASRRSAPSSKAAFGKELRIIQSKILKRKSNIDRLKKTKKGISIPASALRTSSGTSLDTLRSEIRNGGRMSSFEIRSSLKEITSILNEDIRTTGRLLR